MCICPICLDTLSSPVALPCGHVFCRACLVHALQFTTTPVPVCPTCRAALPSTALDPAVIPPCLRPYVHPPLRRLYVTPDPTPAPAPPSTAEDPSTRAARLEAENTLLRAAVARWRLFADAQLAAAARARAYACVVHAESEALKRECAALKRRIWDADGDRPAKRRAGVQPGEGSTSGLIPADILSDSCPPLARRKGSLS